MAAGCGWGWGSFAFRPCPARRSAAWGHSPPPALLPWRAVTSSTSVGSGRACSARHLRRPTRRGWFPWSPSARRGGGRAGPLLEGESGVNDPVGMGLMIGMLEYATHAHASFWTVVREFAVEMSVGLAIGIAGALILLQSIRRIRLLNPALYPLRSVAGAGVIYGVTAVAHGSGFLAVFVAGILLGDADYPHRREVIRFH